MRVVSLLNSGADIQTEDQSRTPLQWASQYGHLQAVRLLISRGAQLNHQDEVGTSALTQAARHGHTNIVVELVKAGAKLDLQIKV
ncbi:Ankyrin repeat, SAM and basic leucine zipper domain-containing protein 1 [Geodia barretti]|uniref:Ankyrin repeat, SAM and basic leucine zipper domain-containing protein 1 n=1 Tax=Geodia barretti TaxID=519541 RepID=A0AA35WLY9_GEOBA|nr:Ankyrin repeat, SAM and basic leucine zipper domain-containing protein 1 [Geodia barretti]